MARSRITDSLLLAHVTKMGEEHPPVPLASVDFTVNDPDLTARMLPSLRALGDRVAYPYDDFDPYDDYYDYDY